MIEILGKNYLTCYFKNKELSKTDLHDLIYLKRHKYVRIAVGPLETPEPQQIKILFFY
jgi:hypothetical protein